MSFNLGGRAPLYVSGDFREKGSEGEMGDGEVEEVEVEI